MRGQQLREELRAHMAANDLNPFSLSKIMKTDFDILLDHETIRKLFAGDQAAEDGAKLWHPTHSTLKKVEAYLKRAKYGPTWSEYIEISSISDALFSGLCQKFGVKQGNFEKSKKIMEGEYQFYANSEFRPIKKGDHHVVVGAMRYYTCKTTNALKVYERQESTALRRDENGVSQRIVREELWDGYYFMRKDMVVTILKGPESVPKFYILKPLHRDLDSGAVSELRGNMFKIGIDGGVFTSPILMIRDPQAFNHCRVVRVGPGGGGGIDPDFARYLRP